MSINVAIIRAYENKFGTWTSQVYNVATKKTVIERFSTYDEARNHCKVKAWDMFGPVNYAGVRMKAGAKEYKAFCYAG